MDLAEAWRRYLANPADEETRFALDRFAFQRPWDTWVAFGESVMSQTPDDDVLARAAAEMIDACRTSGRATVRQRIKSDAQKSTSLTRVVTAIERYEAKYNLLFDLLRGASRPLPATLASDLPLPNIDEVPQPPPSRGAAVIPSVTGFLAHDYEAWEAAQELIDRDPEAAWAFLLTVLPAAAHDDHLSWAGASLLEPLVSHETLLSSAILAALSSSARFRKTLRTCYVNPSERFLDQMIAIASSPASDRARARRRAIVK